jgi:hypothetical protein
MKKLLVFLLALVLSAMAFSQTAGDGEIPWSWGFTSQTVKGTAVAWGEDYKAQIYATAQKNLRIGQPYGIREENVSGQATFKWTAITMLNSPLAGVKVRYVITWNASGNCWARDYYLNDGFSQADSLAGPLSGLCDANCVFDSGHKSYDEIANSLVEEVNVPFNVVGDYPFVTKKAVFTFNSGLVQAHALVRMTKFDQDKWLDQNYWQSEYGTEFLRAWAHGSTTITIIAVEPY